MSGRDLSPVLKQVAAALREAQSALMEQQPKVEAFNELMDSEGCCTLQRAAKIIDWPDTLSAFYQYLVDKGDVYRKVNYDFPIGKREYWPNESSRKEGYFKSDTTYVRVGDRNIAAHITKVTTIGLDHLRRLVKKDFDLEDDE